MGELPQIDSVITSLNIIEVLAAADGAMRVSEIAESLNVPRPRIFRHLRTLKIQGFAAQELGSEKYYLTVKLFHIGQLIADQSDFLSVARRLMPALRDQVGLSVAVGNLAEGGVRVLDICRHRSALEITTHPGAFFDFHSSAQGKVALAFGPEALLQNLISAPLEQTAMKTEADRILLEDEIKKIKKQGWAVAPGQVLSGINAMASPIFDSSQALVGTLSFVGSLEKLPKEPSESLIAVITKTSEEISHQLGYREVLSA